MLSKMHEMLQTLLKGAIMQTEKALINNCLRVSKKNFCIPTIYNFAVIYREICYFPKKQPTLAVSIVFSIYKQNFTTQ